MGRSGPAPAGRAARVSSRTIGHQVVRMAFSRPILAAFSLPVTVGMPKLFERPLGTPPND